MPLKELLQDVSDCFRSNQPLPIEKITHFVNETSLHRWDKDLPQHQFDKHAVDLNNFYKAHRNYQSQFVELICSLISVLDPRKIVGTYWTPLFKPILTDLSTDHILISNVKQILIESFKLKDKSSQDFIRDLLAQFCHQISTQWDVSKTSPFKQTPIEEIIFEFGLLQPLIFYDLLNEMAIDTSTRLESFLLLKSFIVISGAPTYYLIDSILFNSVVHSAMIDTELAVFTTALSILTILLPIVAFKACPLINQLMYIIFRAVQWEINYPNRINFTDY